MTKQELFARAWPDTVVEESSLRVHVAGLRKALAEQQDQTRYIVNVPGRGYSFAASLAGATAPDRYVDRRPAPTSTRIIGRDFDIGAVADLLAAHRFVTIHGPVASARRPSAWPSRSARRTPSQTGSASWT